MGSKNPNNMPYNQTKFTYSKRYWIKEVFLMTSVSLVGMLTVTEGFQSKNRYLKLTFLIVISIAFLYQLYRHYKQRKQPAVELTKDSILLNNKGLSLNWQSISRIEIEPAKSGFRTFIYFKNKDAYLTNFKSSNSWLKSLMTKKKPLVYIDMNEFEGDQHYNFQCIHSFFESVNDNGK